MISASQKPRAVLAGLLCLALGVPAGVAVDRFFLGSPASPTAMLLGGLTQALSERNIESSRKYHQAQSDLKEVEDRLKVVQETADKEAAQARKQADRVASVNRNRLTELEASQVVLQAETVEVERIVEVAIENPETKRKFREYVDLTEQRIGNLTEERDLYQNMYKLEQQAAERLLWKVDAMDRTMVVTRKRLALSENRVKELEGRKVRFGPGVTVGAGTGLIPPGQAWRPTATVGFSVIWG